ncbi:MAG TPA: hypothetical protein VMJ66_09265 [Geobacteraceae bacterium]|nr:hypothetical protein [Geobacteraceae bacterium]
MTYDEIIQTMHEYYEGLFPKACPRCGRNFATLREYILNTRRVDPTYCYDAEMGNWEPTQPVGTLAYATCSCGDTLALSTTALPLETRHSGLNWLRVETERRGLSPAELLGQMRDEIRKRVLAGP